MQITSKNNKKEEKADKGKNETETPKEKVEE